MHTSQHPILETRLDDDVGAWDWGMLMEEVSVQTSQVRTVRTKTY